MIAKYPLGPISKHFANVPVTNDIAAGIPQYFAEKEAAFDRAIQALRLIAADTYANPRSRSIARKALRGPSPFDFDE